MLLRFLFVFSHTGKSNPPWSFIYYCTTKKILCPFEHALRACLSIFSVFTGYTERERSEMCDSLASSVVGLFSVRISVSYSTACNHLSFLAGCPLWPSLWDSKYSQQNDHWRKERKRGGGGDERPRSLLPFPKNKLSMRIHASPPCHAPNTEVFPVKRKLHSRMALFLCLEMLWITIDYENMCSDQVAS